MNLLKIDGVDYVLAMYGADNRGAPKAGLYRMNGRGAFGIASVTADGPAQGTIDIDGGGIETVLRFAAAFEPNAERERRERRDIGDLISQPPYARQ